MDLSITKKNLNYIFEYIKNNSKQLPHYWVSKLIYLTNSSFNYQKIKKIIFF
jgi:hypothetical protein